ncbi:hypothetical protein PUN28_010867 [Cardiocondyla obscurior]|uniref:THAP-type domain-containing protein n=1 Tax=Cardiocondyla obscurior TaxID=286306 RepID=A0AAW2FKP2_9HYME
MYHLYLTSILKNNNNNNNKEYNKSVLCSDHFNKDCFYTVSNINYLRLKKCALPSLFKKFKINSSHTIIRTRCRQKL